MAPLKGSKKLLATTGVVCAMGGYICGDALDENAKQEQSEALYRSINKLMVQPKEYQTEWFQERGRLLKSIQSLKVSLDSLQSELREQAGRASVCEEEKNSLEGSLESCLHTLQESKNSEAKLDSDWRICERELQIRDNQIDSLERLAKERGEALEEYANRSPMENEFQAIHNCVNAHGNSMSSYQFQKQIKCCIRSVKQLQKKYPHDKLKNVLPKDCEDYSW